MQMLTCLLWALMILIPALADELPVLKPDVPKVDQSTSESKLSSPEEKARGIKGPLQGVIKHNEKFGAKENRLKGRAQGGGLGGFLRGYSDSNRLRGQTRNNQFNVEAKSGIGIIGVKFVMFGGRPPVINRIFPNTPAADKGLKIDDIIVAVDGVPTFGLTKEEVYDMIVGTPGTTVTLSVRRNGEFQAMTLNRMDLNDITDPWVRRDYMMSM